MNCIERITRWRERKPAQLAVWDYHHGSITFDQLFINAAGWQKHLEAHGFKAGDTLLVVAPANASVYAVSLAVIGLGGRLMAIDPDLCNSRVSYAVSAASPSILITSTKHRSPLYMLDDVTTIQHRLTLESHPSSDGSKFRIVDVAPDTCASITLTSGTKGRPKGVIRTHKFTLDLVDLLTEGGCRDAYDAPDLTIFPEIGMLHLFSGRGTITVGQAACPRELRAAARFAAKAQPKTLTANASFFKRIADVQGFESLAAIYIGGSCVDITLVDQICNRWPAATITHVYGCREADPIAIVDARTAATKARELGELKLRYLGEPLPFLKTCLTDEGLWVSGPNVCAEALIDPSRGITPTPDENTGYAWHLTSDLIDVKNDGWYFGGDTSMPSGQFQLEQRAYQGLGHTKAFVKATRSGAKLLFTESCPKDRTKLMSELPEISGVVETTIRYDHRNLDQIDRAATVCPPRALKRWQVFTGERSNLIGIGLIAAGPVFGGFTPHGETRNYLLAALSFVFVAAGLVLARIMDECKDYEKDCVVNPTRPLPRGLLTVGDMRLGIHTLTVAMTTIAFSLAYLQATWAAIMGLGATLYLLLMEREFFVGERLARSPIVYALVHQLLIVPLYLLPLLAVPRTVELSPVLMAGFILANLGGSMAYEISRKLSPFTVAGAGTYLQVYGPRLTSYLLVACGFVTVVGSVSMRTVYLSAPAAVILLAALMYWRRHPEKYRLVESASLLVGISSLWALTLL
ncbi:MAG: AMP-binding protein [Deltaproteobacteria bacterium]|nr:AMP-binding protein [Deltaproteobacteria bacterium]